MKTVTIEIPDDSELIKGGYDKVILRSRLLCER